MERGLLLNKGQRCPWCLKILRLGGSGANPMSLGLSFPQTEGKGRVGK